MISAKALSWGIVSCNPDRDLESWKTQERKQWLYNGHSQLRKFAKFLCQSSLLAQNYFLSQEGWGSCCWYSLSAHTTVPVPKLSTQPQTSMKQEHLCYWWWWKWEFLGLELAKPFSHPDSTCKPNLNMPQSRTCLFCKLPRDTFDKTPHWNSSSRVVQSLVTLLDWLSTEESCVQKN